MDFIFKSHYKKTILSLLVVLSAPIYGQAQELADKILAVVGKNKIILNSDAAGQEMNLRKQFPDFNDSMRCQLVQQMVVQKLMVEQGERDSIIISPEEVEASIDNRIRYFMRLYGSKEQLEAAAGKTVYQLKDDYREFTKEEMLAERVQSGIINSVKVTPSDVRKFFEEISQDTLPFLPGTVEVGQIVLAPAVNPELDKMAYEKLEEIRKDIVENGKDFEVMASIYSDDPGSKDDGGDLGYVNREDMVPEFSNAGFRLKENEISPIVKTKFGYHIIQLLGRDGAAAHLRHILIKPGHTNSDYDRSLVTLDSIKTLIENKKTTFNEAVGKYSTDDYSKMTGGMIVDRNTNQTQMQIDQLDPALVLLLDTMKVGNLSAPHVYMSKETGEKLTRIIYLKNRTEPHQANLKDDYNQIMELALQKKKNEKLQSWIKEKTPTFYIKLDPEFAQCPNMASWATSSNH